MNTHGKQGKHNSPTIKCSPIKQINKLARKLRTINFNGLVWITRCSLIALYLVSTSCCAMYCKASHSTSFIVAFRFDCSTGFCDFLRDNGVELINYDFFRKSFDGKKWELLEKFVWKFEIKFEYFIVIFLHRVAFVCYNCVFHIYKNKKSNVQLYYSILPYKQPAVPQKHKTSHCLSF